MSFHNLTPDTILTTVEQATGHRFTGLVSPLPSYINRVYELCSSEGRRFIVKFYRPGRWSREALVDEHRFLADCVEAELPVVAPLPLVDGATVGRYEDIYFALFDKRAGRQLEITAESDWQRLGSLLGRLHSVGARGGAPNRITLGPRRSAAADVEHLCTQVIPEPLRERYRSTATRIIDLSAPLFEDLETIRLHGDCHRGNILDRMDEGLLLIDFDDMVMGPPVQDMWLLLPDRVEHARAELDLLLRGYEQFRTFDRSSLRCIEPLRAMRMIYFAAWCSHQADDFAFRKNFPDWGSESYWSREINDLREQLGFVQDGI